MGEEQLGFDLGIDVPEPKDELSAGQRLTLRQHANVATGVHPLTLEPTRPELGTCGDCIHRVLRSHGPKAYAKCDRPGVRNNHSVTTDVRSWWPACPKHLPA